MKSRLLFIFQLSMFFLLLFTVQKTFFMLLHAGHSGGYLMIVPVLTVVVSCFFDRFALRRILRPYYVVVAIVVTLIFVADAVLYYYWGAKMDANDLMYAANPKDMFASVRWWSVIVGGLVDSVVAVQGDAAGCGTGGEEMVGVVVCACCGVGFCGHAGWCVGVDGKSVVCLLFAVWVLQPCCAEPVVQHDSFVVQVGGLGGCV